MNYFLVQKNNHLIHLPDCYFEEGKREKVEVPVIGSGSPYFIDGRKGPDLFVFTVPPGASVIPCVIVDEKALVRRVLVSTTEIGANTYKAVGVVDETYPARDMENAQKGIAAAMEALKI